ncbi:MAG: heme-degrading monooxygenase HmoA [Cyclobacteriaceae bacterium]|jgi:heme-degrading monooxygenase HmoA
MFYPVWKYTVKEATKSEFEEEYGRQGTWFKLFEKTDNYMGLELLHSHTASQQYILIDRWTSREDYESFTTENREENDALSKRFSYLIENEENDGTFNLLLP